MTVKRFLQRMTLQKNLDGFLSVLTDATSSGELDWKVIAPDLLACTIGDENKKFIRISLAPKTLEVYGYMPNNQDMFTKNEKLLTINEKYNFMFNHIMELIQEIERKKKINDGIYNIIRFLM